MAAKPRIALRAGETGRSGESGVTSHATGPSDPESGRDDTLKSTPRVPGVNRNYRFDTQICRLLKTEVPTHLPPSFTLHFIYSVTAWM